MANVLCPKVGCGWSVDPATVPAGQVVTCPKCGQRFRLAAAAQQPGGSGFGSSLLTIGGVILAVAVLGTVVFLALKQRRPGGPAEGRTAGRVSDLDRNFQFTPPGGDWQLDRDLQNALGTNVIGLHRLAGPEAWAALAVKDYGNRVPLAGELRQPMLAALGRVFDNLPPEPPLEPTTWSGKPASVWKFRGQHKTTGSVCAGEAVAMTHQGVCYWFYGWSAEADFEPAVLQKVRDGFRLLDGRPSWKATTASETSFRSQSSGYQLTTYEKVWEPVPATGGADLELKGVLKGRGSRDFPPKAAVRVWRVSDAGDPSAVADTRVRQENTRDPAAFGPTSFEELTDPPAGDAPPGPETNTTVRRLKVTSGIDDTGKAVRLVAFAGLRVGNDVVVAEATCPWDEREYWERRLVHLVGSLRE